jgi:hypothetical protein
MSPAWRVGSFKWIVRHGARYGTLECDAHDEHVDRPTFVLPDGSVEPQAPASYGFSGVPQALADLSAWQGLSAAFAALAAELNPR